MSAKMGEACRQLVRMHGLRDLTPDPPEITAFLGWGRILTDDRPPAEYLLSLPQNDKPVDFSALRGGVRPYVLPAGAALKGN